MEVTYIAKHQFSYQSCTHNKTNKQKKIFKARIEIHFKMIFNMIQVIKKGASGFELADL